MAEWIAREYLARRGSARFKTHQIQPSRSPLLGYTLDEVHVEGRMITRWFLQVETQPEVGESGYDRGHTILQDFFCECLSKFLSDELDPLGRQIIECCLNHGSVEDYEELIPST